MRSLRQLPIRVRPPFQIPHRAICLIPSIGSWRVYPLHPNRPQREFYSEYSHPIMRLRFGRNLNSLTSYDRINRIMVRTKSCRRWRWSCHESKRERIDYRWRVLPIQSLISIRQFRDSLETSQKPMNFATWWQALLFKSLRACNSFLV